MSAYSDIVAGLQKVLQDNITDLKAYDYPADSVSSFPAAVILPEPLDLELTIGANNLTCDFRVVFLIAGGDDALGFRALYDYIDPAAANTSVKKAVDTDRTLNAKADDAHVVRIENIGRREVWGGFYFGFDAIVQVVKSLA